MHKYIIWQYGKKGRKSQCQGRNIQFIISMLNNLKFIFSKKKKLKVNIRNEQMRYGKKSMPRT